MKKFAIVILAAMIALTGCAHHHYHGFHGGPPPRYHYHGGYWGHAGCNFWPGFIGGVVGGAVVNTVAAPQTVVVPAPQPVYVQEVPQVITVPAEPAVVYTENGNTVYRTRAGITPSGRYYNPRIVEYGRGRQTIFHVKAQPPPPMVVEESTVVEQTVVAPQPRVIKKVTVTETETFE